MNVPFAVRGFVFLVGAAFGILTLPARAQWSSKDDFDDDSNAAWADDYFIGHGQLARTNRHSNIAYRAQT